MASRGHRDRKTGGFSGPEADNMEPERTERLLANPFALRRTRVGDHWQGIEGFLFFRVNGSTRFGTCYQLIVIGVNMLFGTLTGLRPMLQRGSPQAAVQMWCILTLQLAMSFVCFHLLPDADRVISRFAGTQVRLDCCCGRSEALWLFSVAGV
jgi:hypothetical protein